MTRGERRVAELDFLPFGRNFAISIVQDADGTTLERDRAFFKYLSDRPIRITKTVWPLDAIATSGHLTRMCSRAETLENVAFRDWCLQLQSKGHEMAMHTASGGDNTRGRTLRGYSLFEATFGAPPATNVMHGRNRENLYWGREIFRESRALRALVALYEPQRFEGHQLGSEYFWGDVCAAKTRYVRLLETHRLNTRLFDPATPFHDPTKPFVRWWYSASYGGRLLDPVNRRALDGLRERRGFSIIHAYCHLGVREQRERELDAVLRARLDLLSEYDDGWCVPVVELLDRVRAVRAVRVEKHPGGMTLTNSTDVDLPALCAIDDGWTRGTTSRRREAGQDQRLLGDLPPFGKLHVADAETLLYPPRATPPNYRRMFLGTVGRVVHQHAATNRQQLRRKRHSMSHLAPRE